jgi:outer membrane autotransporter protein
MRILLGFEAFAAWKRVVVGAASAVALFAGSGAAQAQCVGDFFPGTFSGAAGSGSAAVSALASVFSSMNTAFNAQGSAFVASPQSPKDGPGGGVWVRGIGGRVDTQSTSHAIPLPSIGPATTGAVDCNLKVHQTYEGAQIGADLGKLNIDGLGGNWHWGLTAGAGQAEFRETSLGQFNGRVDAPFIGLYSVYTKGNFFSDFLARYNTFTATLNDRASLGVFGQRIDARGYSLQGGFGYRFDIPNTTWFIEPSASFLHSVTQVDTVNVPGNFPLPVLADTFEGNISIDDIVSNLGRVGARVGTAFQVANLALQPFAGASVWHEFKSQNSALYTNPFQGQIARITSSNVGTFGQYSAGIAGQIVGTGWLGYARFDYRYGDDIDAWGVNAGLRLQFDPSTMATASVMPVKAPPVAAAPYVWSGFYGGGFGGAAVGNSDWRFIGGDILPIGGLPAAAQAVYPGALNGLSQVHHQGLVLGGQLGYNRQISRWVVGAEADIAWSNQRGGSACPTSLNFQQAALNTYLYNGNLNPAGEPSFFQCNDTRSSPIVTAAGRLGYTWDKVLLFAKGGPAWTRNTYSITFNTPGSLAPGGSLAGQNIPVNRTVSADFAGWTVGAGFELGLTPNWSTKVEYDYIDLGTKTLTFAFPGQNATVSIWDQVHLVKVGLNYHLPETLPTGR